MRAYSGDLRQRGVAAGGAGAPRPAGARTLPGSLAAVKRYLQQRHEVGHLAPRTSPGRPPDIAADRLAALEAQLAAHPDATLAQHCQHWQAAWGQPLSLSAMRRAITRLAWTRKKTTAAKRAGTGAARAR